MAGQRIQSHEQKVVFGDKFEVFTNGEGELFVKILSSGQQYRMQEYCGFLQVATDECKARMYGSLIGMVLKP